MIPDCIANLSMAAVYRDRRGLRKLRAVRRMCLLIFYQSTWEFWRTMAQFLDIPGQGLLQVTELFLAFVLCALIGVEREIRMKSAGLRTHTLVGVSAAL